MSSHGLMEAANHAFKEGERKGRREALLTALSLVRMGEKEGAIRRLESLIEEVQK